MLSIITPVLNFQKSIKNLYFSIIKYNRNEDIEWIIIKESSDTFSAKRFNFSNKLKLIILYTNKKNLYAAINLGIKSMVSKYYIVMGQDDIFYKKGINSFFDTENQNFDFLIFRAISQNNINDKLNRKKFFNHFMYQTNHSGGMFIKREAHNKIGFYEENFKIASDQYFLKQSLLKNLTYKKHEDIISKVGYPGISSLSKKLCLIENFQIDLKLKNLSIVEIIYFIYRYIKFTIFK